MVLWRVRPQILSLPVLADYIALRRERLIVFDGRCGAGKSTAMQAIRSMLGVPGVEADAHLCRGYGPWRWPYIDALQLDQLKEELEQSLRLSKMALLAGVCARQVVDLADLPEAAHIYVEAASPTLLEIQMRDFDDDFNAPDPDPHLHRLHWEVEMYHRSQYKPRASADAVYFAVRGEEA